jgi:hypothetical protein
MPHKAVSEIEFESVPGSSKLELLRESPPAYILQTAQPKRRRKGRKSMNRRSGQNGTIVIQSGWYRVRWRMDVEGHQERINMSEKIAPVIVDKEGKAKPASQAIRRMARDIVERSGANSEERFNLVVLGEATFRDQGKAYLRWAGSRDREPIKDLGSIEAALNKWILPAIGDLPLANINNLTVKPLVDKMKRSLSAKTVNTYVKYIKQIVASLRDGETGEPIHRRKWDSAVMDLPIVNLKQQRRPALKAKDRQSIGKRKCGQRAGFVRFACGNRDADFGSPRTRIKTFCQRWANYRSPATGSPRKGRHC